MRLYVLCAVRTLDGHGLASFECVADKLDSDLLEQIRLEVSKREQCDPSHVKVANIIRMDE